MQFTDQLHRTITLDTPPKRIISLVPSQSELLWDLGLREELAGITKFCIHPEVMFRNVARVGGTKTLDFDKIRAIGPDLIIGNKEENEQAQIEKLMEEFPVWMSDIATYAQALDMIEKVGELTNRTDKAKSLVHEISSAFQYLPHLSEHSGRVLYLIWRDPYMAAGNGTFIDNMITRMGLSNVFDAGENRYPEVTETTIKALDPDFVFLSSEPYPFKDKHISELQSLLPQSKIMLVDGELFSWYGSRLRKAPAYLHKLQMTLQGK